MIIDLAAYRERPLCPVVVHPSAALAEERARARAAVAEPAPPPRSPILEAAMLPAVWWLILLAIFRRCS